MARRVLHDRYFKQAKAEGYLARSAYKLQEIQQRKKLMRPGHRVLDLGCAPGSWLQVASEFVGPKGLVVGVDLQDVRAPMPANVRTVVGDIEKLDADAILREAGESSGAAGTAGKADATGRFDVVLSDMAPPTTGAGDAFRSARLCERVLALLPDLLRPGGNLAMKVLEGEPYPDLLKRTQGIFETARGFKPKASRDVSREMYIVAHGYRGGTGGG